MSNEIQVVAACDDRYAPALSVTLLSMFELCATRPIKVYVLVAEGFSQRANLLASMGDKADQLTFLTINSDTFRGLKLVGEITVATYYRVLVGKLLPETVKKVIYLDCDLLFRSSIADLWDIPLGDHLAAAVPDTGTDPRQDGKTLHVLPLEKGSQYFNAGLLVINVALWRSEGIAEQVLTFAGEHPEMLTWADQCALNWVLRDRWKILEGAWNVQSDAFQYHINNEPVYYHPMTMAALASKVVHFTGPEKPWFYLTRHPFKPEFQRLFAQTPWGRKRPEDLYPHNIIRRTLREHAPFLLPVYKTLRRYA